MENIFLSNLETLLKKHDIEKTKEFFHESLSNAIENHETGLIILILNEMIGFYRDISLYDESYKYANSLLKMTERISLSLDNLFISYINIANSFRASSHLNEAITLFNKAKNLYTDNSLSLSYEYAALLNNLALAYQETKNYKEAIKLLNEALTILDKKDLVKIATTHVNLANSYLIIDDYENAFNSITIAKNIFDNYKNDFHYGFFLAGYARILAYKKEFEAIKYYEEALGELSMNIGKSETYDEVYNEYLEYTKKFSYNPHISGVELALMYFNTIKEQFFDAIPLSLHSKIVIGLFGLGSECFFCDDLISEDHDFDPGFIVLINDDVSKDDFKTISNAYNSLPKLYKRYYIRPLDKKGVHYYKEYLKDFLGAEDLANLSIQSKGLLTNGKLFYTGLATTFNHLRNEIIKNNRYDFIPLLINKTLEINQYIPYNLNRAKERNDYDTYKILKSHLIDRLIEYYYLIHYEFIPHDKLQLKKMNKDSIIYKYIIRILNDNLEGIFEEISASLLYKLKEFGIINSIANIYIEDYRNILLIYKEEYLEKKTIISKIVALEWNSFKDLDNIGGKANCQNNSSYFRLMRESQFYVWDISLLKSYLADLETAANNNYNLLAIKYGFMEESTDPINYLKIKKSLPILSEKRIKLQEGIISLQLEMLNNYSNEFDKSLMRSSTTSTDSLSNTSYETYLRGEISSYSENTLFLYGKMISTFGKNNQNIVELTLKMTNLLKTNEEY